MVSILASRPHCPRFDSQHSRNFFRGKKLSCVAEVNWRHFLEESGQWLENVHRTHLVLTSDRLVPQKNLLTQILVVFSLFGSFRPRCGCWMFFSANFFEIPKLLKGKSKTKTKKFCGKKVFKWLEQKNIFGLSLISRSRCFGGKLILLKNSLKEFSSSQIFGNPVAEKKPPRIVDSELGP